MLFELILIWLNNSYNYKSRYIKFLSIFLLTFTTKSLLRLRTVGAKFEFWISRPPLLLQQKHWKRKFSVSRAVFFRIFETGLSGTSWTLGLLSTWIHPAAAAAVSGDRWSRAVPLSSQQVSRAKEFYRCPGLFFDTYSVFYTKFTRSLVARSSLRGWGR